MSAQSHRSNPRILKRRKLERDHRCLAELLRPGMSVLDVGCGTGSITAGIAGAVGAEGRVVGVDRDEELLGIARTEHGSIPTLRFEATDATRLNFHAEFDIVTAARVLQWISEPDAALAKMIEAAKPGGMLVVLDYNHAHSPWEPDPPVAFQRFYQAFLAWREANGWDNQMAAHLPDLFRSAGLVEIEGRVQDEIVVRGDPDFAEQSVLFLEVIEALGNRIVESGFCTESELAEARDSYGPWASTELTRQTLQMRAVIGRVSPGPGYSPGPAAA
jgi:SAM-dependent methyltransferase